MWWQIIWNDEPGGNVGHIEEHGLTVEDVEFVLANPDSQGRSRSSGQRCVFGYTPGGLYTIVIFELIDDDTVYPVTAYEVPEPESWAAWEEGGDRDMAKREIHRIVRPATPEERRRHAEIRDQVMQEFPPRPDSGRSESPPGIPAKVRRAREAKGLTWYAVAELAGLPSAGIVRDIEYGRDAPLSSVQAVARVLDLRLELVAEPV
jgi:hypothetical protein